MANEPMLLLYLVSFLVWSALCLVIGLFVYLKNPKRELNKRWFYLSIFVSVWSLGRFMVGISTNASAAIFWGKFLHVFAIPIPVLYLQFVYALTEEKNYSKKLINILYLLVLIFWLSTFGNHFIKGVESKLGFPFYEVPGKIYYIWTATWLGGAAFAIYELMQRVKKTSGLKRNQLKLVLIASLMGFLGGSTAFFPVYNIPLYPVGAPFAAAYPCIIAYAILRYRLMDIDIVFKKGTVYAFLTFLTLIPCMLIIVFAQKSFFGEANYTFSWLIFGLLLLTAFLFAKIKSRAEESVERTLFREKYEYKRILREFSKRLVSFLDEQDLLNNMAHALTEVLGIDKISLILFDKEKKIYRTRASRNLDDHKIMELSFPQNDPFFAWLKERREIAVREELERAIDNPKIDPMIERLKFMESEVCIPLLAKHELIGIVNLGNKISRNMYSHEDIELLNYFASQAAIALENARLYEDLKKSKLIIRRADKLASLGTLSAGLAHEIKNPLVAIKTFIQLLPERFDDEEFRNYFFNVASGEVDRLSDLINTLLDFARPSEPSFQMGNINEIMNKVILLIENEAKRKNLNIKRHYSSDVPEVMLDPEQIKQVFLNIILNATEATPENGFLTVETRRLDKDRGREFVQVEVRDTGRGISKENLERIFEPFFSTKDGGSGLGLAVSHHIVQEHQGYIEVESEVGMGTSFFINLPVNPLVMPRKEEKDRFWSLI